jgi:hypothetical protein
MRSLADLKQKIIVFLGLDGFRVGKISAVYIQIFVETLLKVESFDLFFQF